MISEGSSGQTTYLPIGSLSGLLTLEFWVPMKKSGYQWGMVGGGRQLGGEEKRSGSLAAATLEGPQAETI